MKGDRHRVGGEALVFELAAGAAIDGVRVLCAEGRDVEMPRATPDFLVRRERNADVAVRNTGMREQIFHSRHDLGHTRFVVRAQQRRPGGGDDVVADALGQCRDLGCTQHDRAVVRQDEVRPIVAPMHDGSHAGTRHFRRRVDVRNEADDRRVRRCRRNGRRHVPMLIDLDVRGAQSTKLGGEIIEQHDLAWRARIGHRSLVGLGVVLDVTEKAFEYGAHAARMICKSS